MKADNRSQLGTACSQRNTSRVPNGESDDLIGAGKQTPKGKEFTYRSCNPNPDAINVFPFLPTFDRMHSVRISSTLFDFTYQLQESL
jgi:hypothetical protein